MNLVALKDELTNDPLNRAYYAMGDESAANSLNTANRSGYRSLTTGELLSWGAANARLAKLADAANGAGEFSGINAVYRSVAIAANVLLQSGVNLDLSAEQNRQLFLVLTAAGVFTQEDAGQLMALAATQISRGVELGLGMVTPSHVADARRLT